MIQQLSIRTFHPLVQDIRMSRSALNVKVLSVLHGSLAEIVVDIL